MSSAGAPQTVALINQKLSDDVLSHLFKQIEAVEGADRVLVLSTVCHSWAHIIGRGVQLDTLAFYWQTRPTVTLLPPSSFPGWLKAALARRSRVRSARSTHVKIDGARATEDVVAIVSSQIGREANCFGIEDADTINEFLTEPILVSIVACMRVQLCVLNLPMHEQGQCSSLTANAVATFVQGVFQFPKLTHLSLENWEIPPQLLKAVYSKAVLHAPLRSIDLSGCGPFEDDDVSQFIQAYPHLIVSRIVVPGFGPKSMAVCCSSDRNPVVSYQPSRTVPSFDLSLWQLFVAKQGPNLVHLDLSAHSEATNDRWLEAYFKSLDGTDLSETPLQSIIYRGEMQDATMQALVDLCPRLYHVRVDIPNMSQSLGNRGFEALATLSDRWKLLREVIISESGVTDEQLIACAPQLTSLTALGLASTDTINGECFPELAKHCKDLVFLDVSHNWDIQAYEMVRHTFVPMQVCCFCVFALFASLPFLLCPHTPLATTIDCG